MENFRKIQQIAKLFDLPVSTLHYWEQEGLFSAKRASGSNYRLFSQSDILNIWEIVLYRELGIPVKSIGALLQDDAPALLDSYCAAEETLREEMELIEEKLAKIQRQKKLIALLAELEQRGLSPAAPDLDFCVRDVFDMESMRLTLRDPYLCTIVCSSDSAGAYVRGICKPKGDIIWQKQPDKKWLEFLLRANIEDFSDNNLHEICTQVRAMGYVPGSIIARYLLITSSGGKRRECYRAWVEIS